MKKKFVILVLISILIIGLIGLTAFFIIRKGDDKNEKVVKVIEKIAEYNYSLDDRDTELYKTEYFLLKENLVRKDIDYKSYASSIAKMFIIDLYTINNKLNKYDVGGLDFLIEDYKENFILQVENTLYKYIEDNTYETREQVLPEVKEIAIDEIIEKDYTLNDIKYSGYQIKLSWTYTSDNEYDNNGLLTVVNKDNKLFIVSKEDIK